jgi:hypothetical protein
MIAFGVRVAEPEPYRRYAEPGIRLAAEADSEIFAFAAVGTIGRGYNLLLDAAVACEDLEALVIVHPHTEIADTGLCATVRAVLADPDVAVAGCAGAAGVRTIAWWEGRVSAGDVIRRYTENGGGEMPAYPWAQPEAPPAVVDTVDGALLVLSPWAVANLRFDEGLHLGHGFDLDYCLQAREQGRTVVTFDTRVIQHRPLDIVSDLELWIESHIQMAAKWEGRIPGQEPDRRDPQLRARRAEAEREAVRALAYSRRLAFDARVQELQNTIDAATESRTWRATAPLREVNLWRRSRRDRRRPPSS